MEIRKLNRNEEIPVNLLLLADPSKEHINEYIKKGECFVADDNNRIIGVSVLLPTRPSTIELVNLAVAEDYQGKGIGKKLILDAMRRAKVMGYKTIEVGTANSSIDQLAFYQKCGFRITGIDRDFFIRHYPETIFENGIQAVDMIRFSKDLS
ncbi:GNAT family N-acetyltransferase [Bacillus sp. FJAT-49711]|uniref:GNAT family N-acetyltransferase n=1 Tax=Bacillus sp. FJAT-49711 TaxID=2833585 RepID=UPI001BCA0C94|nr:GNAT family N-acetyltransferase [Bacillus sp. FJAT-49711]MBS4217589.1 GNAT family N-acetyltransferase [Bacillus sp. FJAT-49711]